MSKRLTLALFAAAAALAAGGCGSSSSSDTSGSATASSSTSAAAPAKPPVDQMSAPAITARLENAGYRNVESVEVSDTPKPDVALETKSSGKNLTLYRYANSNDAQDAAANLSSVEKQNPDQIAVKFKNRDVYVVTVQEPAKVTAADLKKFIAAVEAGQGGNDPRVPSVSDSDPRVPTVSSDTSTTP